MLEVVYSGKEMEDLKEVRVPKNIRQVGSSSGDKKIYIEDYVANSMKKPPEKEDSVKYGVLLGDINRFKGITYIFVRGMVETCEVIENSIIFNDDIWSNIYKDIKKYFEDLEIIGWFVSLPYTVNKEMTALQKLHLDNFAGNDKICFLIDRTENEEGVYRYDCGSMKKENGYYIFYEKNEAMKQYVRQTKGSRGVPVEANSVKEINVSATEEVKKKDETIDNQNVKMGSFKEMLMKQLSNDSEENNKGAKFGKIAYGISSLLIIALLLSTVVMMNNYGELQKLKSTIDGNNENNAIAVNEILSSIVPTTVATETTIEGETTTEVIETTVAKEEEVSVETETEVNVVVESQNDETQQEDEYINGVNSDYFTDDFSWEEVENQENQVAAGAYSGMYHQVEVGQTLYDISIIYYGDSSMVEQIKELNNIGEDYLIKEGDKLLLP